MKKKNFLNGMNAKMALAVVALSGALLTGCYKDEGLDANTPGGEVTLPAATYTIAGTVLDAETLQPINASDAKVTTAADGTATITNGGFSLAVTSVSGEKTVSLVASATGYESTTVDVKVKELKAGQSAVYTPVIMMQAKKDGTYNLTVKVYDENATIIDGAKVVVFNEAMQDVTANMSKLAAGTYIVKASKAGYVTKTTEVILPSIKANESKTINVILTKAATGNVRLSGTLKIGNDYLNAKSIELKNAAGKVLGAASGYTYNFSVPTSEFKPVAKTKAAVDEFVNMEAEFTFAIVDQNNAVIKYKRTFKISVAEDGTVEGETGSEGGANVDLIFAVETEVASEAINDAWTIERITTVDWCNEDNEAFKFNFKYTQYSGTELINKDAVKAAINALGTGAIYDAAYAALTNYAGIVVVENVVKEIEIPALTLLKTVKTTQEFTESVVVVKDITVNGEPADAADLVASFKDVKANTKTAEQKVFDASDTETIEHAHAHGHGHGANPNAGGGIVEAE